MEGQKKVGLMEFDGPEEAYEALDQTGLHELLNLPQWCCFKLKERNGKITKPPFNPLTGRELANNSLRGWTDFKTAFSKAKEGDYAGVGLNMIGYTGIDLDHCYNPDTGEISPFAGKVLDSLTGIRTYSEISVSGSGIHIFFKGCLKDYLKTDLDVWGTHKEIEIYSPYLSGSGNIAHARYIAVTGNVFNSEGSEVLSEDLSGVVKLLKQYDPEKLIEAPCESLEALDLEYKHIPEDDSEFIMNKLALIERCKQVKNGEVFTALFNEGIYSEIAEERFWDEDKGKVDQNRAEGRLCYDLAFGCLLCFRKFRPDLIDSCFRDSAFMKQSQGREPEKWDRVHSSSGDTYGKMTIDGAMKSARMNFSALDMKTAADMFSGEQESGEDADPSVSDEESPKKGIARFFNKNTLNHSLFADFLIEKFHIKRLNGVLYIYRNNRYSSAQKEFERAMNSIIPNLRETQRKEVLKSIELKIENNSEYSPPEYIRFRNGVLNINSMELLKHSPEYVTAFSLPYDWNPEARSEVAASFLEGIADGNPLIKKRLLEMIGYTFYFPNCFQKFFILSGSGANGKSLLLDVITYLHGPENCSALDIPDLLSAFRPAEIIGKTVNICSDMTKGMVDKNALSTLKRFTGGDVLTFERKGKDPVKALINAILIFGANGEPKFGSGDTKAVLRRIEFIPLEADFSESSGKADPHLKGKLLTPENASYFYLEAVKALKELLQRGQFTREEKNEAFKAEFLSKNDPYEAWKKDLEELGTDIGSTVDGMEKSEAFDLFEAFCFDQRINNPYSYQSFCSKVLKEPGVQSYRPQRDGKRVRAFRCCLN